MSQLRSQASAQIVTVADGKLSVGAADAVWEVVAGTTDGKYMLKSSTGVYMLYGGSSTGISLGDHGTEFEITCGEGTSKIDLGTIGTTHRLFAFRMNGTVPQFRAYSEANTKPEYSWDITIWKTAD